ncbi:hypothetical protein EDB83DRAFT_2515877 [Lactarius deliciosus]|nr:hypothetical protein EDB83DRAFT_2515877 [Lactarius deliciosus]
MTQPDNTTDATAAAKTTEGADSVDATVAHGMDAEDPSDTADITDADVYEQLTHNAQYFAAYPEQERSVEQASPAQSQSIEPQHPPPISPICSEPDDLNPLPELVVDRFPYGSAGVPVPGVHQGLSLHRTSLEGLGTSIWAPFRSQCDWEFAHWAKMRGPTSSAVAALLAVPQLVDRLKLSYRNTRELDAIIDQELPGRPPFKCWDLLIGGETLHLYYRDIIQCLWSLFGDPELARDMVFTPERHYTERDRTCRVYSDMHTGDWWWAVQEHKEMCRILLGLIVDLPLPSGQVTSRIVRSIHALLDFLYLAQLPSQTTDTITRLDEALARFHSNKAVFVDLGVREHFNIPKFHSLMHYSTSIALFGTTDNYNTEQTERLHIDFTKDAYRATNHKGEYPQMTTWLERCKKVLQHTAFIKRRQQPVAEERSSQPPIGPSGPVPRSMKMTRNPSAKAVSFDHLSEKHGAIDFQDALADFIARVNHPEASAAALRTLAANTLIPFRSVPVFYRIKFTSNSTSTVIDTVHVRPEQRDTHGRSVPSRFNTVIVHHRHRPGGRAQGNKFNGTSISDR